MPKGEKRKRKKATAKQVKFKLFHNNIYIYIFFLKGTI